MHCITRWAMLVAIILASGAVQPAAAQLTPDHRKELTELAKQANEAGVHLKKKEYAEAEKVLDGVDKKLAEIATAAGLTENDPAVKRVAVVAAKQRALLEKATGGGKGAPSAVSFVKDVAPIIDSRCVECHGENNPRGNLRLDTFTGWRNGGRGGLVLAPGAAARSLIIAKLTSTDEQARMPRRGDALPKEQIETISTWINQGARFDGARIDMSLADLMFEEAKGRVKLPKATGSEQVKFTQDIAPWFTSLCLNCHNSRRRSGGLSVETYFDIMKGGKSGEVIFPGDMENSRLFLLVGGKELPRMPQGQARITRRNYDDLVQWFKEGNTFDGPDARAPISSFQARPMQAPTDRFSTMSDADLAAFRQKQVGDKLREALSGEKVPFVTSPEFLVTGDAPESQLNAALDTAEDELPKLRKALGGEGLPWRGRLAVFVMKDRESYDALSEALDGKRPDRESFGHFRVSPNREYAHVVVLSGAEPPLKPVLIEQLGAAYVQRSGKPLPGWLVHGIGVVMAEPSYGDRRALEQLEAEARSLAPAVVKPEEVFVDSSFSEASLRAVGYTLVKFLQQNGGPARFTKFLQEMEGGKSLDAALQSAYGADSSALAAAYFASLKKR